MFAKLNVRKASGKSTEVLIIYINSCTLVTTEAEWNTIRFSVAEHFILCCCFHACRMLFQERKRNASLCCLAAIIGHFMTNSSHGSDKLNHWGGERVKFHPSLDSTTTTSYADKKNPGKIRFPYMVMPHENWHPKTPNYCDPLNGKWPK